MLTDAAEMPPWKKELILRIRSKGAAHLAAAAATPQTASAGGVHQPAAATACSSSGGSSCSASGLVATRLCTVRCNSAEVADDDDDKMVQARTTWTDREEPSSERSVDSDSSEELKYGPGIVSKLKNRYLSLTLREATLKTRPSILTMRKATSLEHILDKDEPGKKDFQHYNINGHSKHVPSRYRTTTKKPDMKRARSAEFISNATSNEDEDNDPKPKRESLHEDMLNANRKEEIDKGSEINDIKTFSNNLGSKVNKPKRLQPIMTEKEKPPLDVVRQTKKLFERADRRTKSPVPTGEVAAKVATFKEIIETKKPPLKQKPHKEPNKKITPNVPTLRSPTVTVPPPKKTTTSLPTSPIPDVSLVEPQDVIEKRKSSLTETPDLILHSSQSKLKRTVEEPETVTNGFSTQLSSDSASSSDEDTVKKIPQNQNLGNSMLFDFSAKPKIPNYLPITQSENPPKLKRSAPVVSLPPKSRQKPPPPVTVNVPITEPLKVEVTPNYTIPQISVSKKDAKEEAAKTNGKLLSMSDIVIEKNLKNAAKNSEVAKRAQFERGAKKLENVKNVDGAKVDVVSVAKVTKRAPRKQEQQNCLVFDFTTRKDVPDYVGNDGRIKTGKIEKPKPGEGGFTLLPGATLDESLIDDDEDWKKSLEGPPSPLLVTFVNDNVLIDGKSSLSQKMKRPKMSIKFVDCEPDIFVYPSESSSVGDETQTTQLSTNSSTVGHNVPTLSGSSLANYKSKTAHQMEDFQLGLKPTTPTSPLLISEEKIVNNHSQEEESNEVSYQPIAFSAGTNTDILF